MREGGLFPFLLVMFMGVFTSILLGSDYHINDENVDGYDSVDQLQDEDSSLTRMTAPWRMQNNFHPRDRFRKNTLDTMTNSVNRPTIHRSNDWKVLSTTSYTVLVGSLVDNTVNVNGCSTSSKLLTCNVRSAWAYCMSLINQQSCGNSAVVSCAVVLPSGTTSTVMSGTYGVLDLSALTSWATSCTLTQVSLSMVGSVTGGLVASIQGDGTSTGFIDAESVGFLTLIMSDINVAGFGDGTATFLSAVVVNSLQGSVFQRVSFSNNVGYATGSAVYATAMGSMLFTACVFTNNQQTYVWDPSSAVSGFGGAMAIYSAASVSILKSKFINNYSPGGAGGGGAVYIDGTNNIYVSDSLFKGNAIVGVYNGGGGLLIANNFGAGSTNSTINRCIFTGNSLGPGAAGGQGAGLAFQVASQITIKYCQFNQNLLNGDTATGGGGLSFFLTTAVTIDHCSFTNNSIVGDKTGGGGGISFYLNSGGATITNSNFSFNSVVGQIAGGGGIYYYQSPNLIMSNCIFTNNSVNNGGKGWDQAGGLGIEGGDNHIITHTSFYNNSATTWGGGLSLTSSNYVLLDRLTFINNSAGSAGGGIFLTNAITYVGMIGITFINNRAVNGFGGAISVGPNCQYLSLGGLMPIFETCIGCGNDGKGTAHQPGHTNYVTYQLMTYPDYRVKGYLVTFPTTSDKVSIYCQDWIKVGDYYYGKILGDDGSSCPKGQYSPYGPGYQGIPPYRYNGPKLPINISHAILPNNPYITFTVYPFAQVTSVTESSSSLSANKDGTNGGLIFDRNYAGTFGGAISVDSTVSNLFVMPGTSFTRNSAKSGGGAVYVNDTNSGLYFYSATFSRNRAPQGGAVYVFNQNTAVHYTDCTFFNNTAQVGGAVYMGTGNGNGLSLTVLSNVLRFTNVTFRSNTASLDGGAIYGGFLNSFIMNQSLVTNNIAGGRGGAVYLGYSNKPVTLSGSTFTQNTAQSGGGGAIYTDASLNGVSIDGTTFIANVAQTSGGAVYANIGNTFALTSGAPTSFLGNRVQGIAGSGLASSGAGGAVSLLATPLSIGVCNVSFTNNSAAQGSGLYLDSLSTVTLTNTSATIRFTNNVCKGHGGTVYWVADPSAGGSTGGGALGGSFTKPLLFDYQLPNYPRRVKFSQNSASLSPTLATQPTALRVDNSGLFRVTAYNALLSPALTVFLVDHYGVVNKTDNSTSVTVTVLPGYNCGGGGHIGYLSGTTTVVAKSGKVAFDTLSAYCYPGGNMTVQFQGVPSGFDAGYRITTTRFLTFRNCLDGETLLNNQCVPCPSGSYSLHYGTPCTPCPDGTDSCFGGTIVASPGYWRISPLATILLTCPLPSACVGGSGVTNSTKRHTDDDGGRHRVLGGWDTVDGSDIDADNDEADVDGDGGLVSSSTHTHSQARALRARALTALTSTTRAFCAKGYHGPLCAVCVSGYYLSKLTDQCLSCQGRAGGEQLALLITVPSIMLILGIVASMYRLRSVYKKLQESTSSQSDKARSSTVDPFQEPPPVILDSEKGGNAATWGFSTRNLTERILPKATVHWMRSLGIGFGLSELRMSHIGPKLKILVASFQIYCQLPDTLQLKFPGSTTKVFSVLSFVNLSSISAGSPQCYTTFDYVDKLLMTTLTPICIEIVVVLSFLAHVAYKSRAGWHHGDFGAIVSTYVSFFLVVSYLVLPSVSTTIFGSFNCVSVDPENLVPGIPKYLRLDYSISCDSPRYRFGKGWAIAMIFIYPVGIPTMYFYLLYHARHMVQKRKRERRVKEEKLREEALSKKASGEQMKLYLASLKAVQAGQEGGAGYVDADPSPYQSDKGIHSNKNDTDSNKNDHYHTNNNSNNHSTHGTVPPATGNPMMATSDHTTLPLRQISPLHSPLAVNRPSTLGAAIIASRQNSPEHSRAVSEQGGEGAEEANPNKHVSIMDLLSNEIGFLHNAYRGSCWYWEVVEACRKLLLTAVLSIVATGQSAQIVFAICVIVIFMVASYVEPHFYHEDDFLSELTNYGILLVLFIALLLRTNAMGSDWLRGMDAVIILLVMVPIVVAILSAADAPGYIRNVLGRRGVVSGNAQVDADPDRGGADKGQSYSINYITAGGGAGYSSRPGSRPRSRYGSLQSSRVNSPRGTTRRADMIDIERDVGGSAGPVSSGKKNVTILAEKHAATPRALGPPTIGGDHNRIHPVASDMEEGKSSVRIGGRLGMELASATNINLVAGPDPSPGPSPGPLANPTVPDVNMNARGGTRLASISSPMQNASTEGTYASGSPAEASVAGDGMGMGVSSPGPVASSPIPNNQRHKQRRTESWDNSGDASSPPAVTLPLPLPSGKGRQGSLPPVRSPTSATTSGHANELPFTNQGAVQGQGLAQG